MPSEPDYSARIEQFLAQKEREKLPSQITPADYAKGEAVVNRLTTALDPLRDRDGSSFSYTPGSWRWVHDRGLGDVVARKFTLSLKRESGRPTWGKALRRPIGKMLKTIYEEIVPYLGQPRIKASSLYVTGTGLIIAKLERKKDGYYPIFGSTQADFDELFKCIFEHAFHQGQLPNNSESKALHGADVVTTAQRSPAISLDLGRVLNSLWRWSAKPAA